MMVSQINVTVDFGKETSEDLYVRYGESGRVVNFNYINSNIDGDFSIPDGTTLKFILVKSDGTFVMQEFTNSLTLTENMCSSVGIGRYEILYNDTYILSGSGNFYTESRVLTDDVIDSYTDVYGLRFPEDFQQKLTAGDGINISNDNVISFSGEVDFLQLYTDLKSWKNASILNGVASFETVEETLLNTLQVQIKYTQDLHGYEYPWLGGTGKNILPLTLDVIKNINTNGTWNNNRYTYNGLTFDVIVDQSNNINGINVNGTAVSQSQFILYRDLLNSCPFNNNVLNGCPQSGSSTSYEIRLSDIDVKSINDFGGGAVINLNDTGKWQASILVRNGYTAYNLMFLPMIRQSIDVNPDFTPYTNICPINGWTNINITLQNSTQSKVYSIQLGQTVYYGSLDVVNGILTITHKNVKINSLEWGVGVHYDKTRFYSNIIDDIAETINYTNGLLSSCFRINRSPLDVNNVNGCLCQYTNNRLYASLFDCSTVQDFLNKVGDESIMYKLRTNTVINLTPQEILTLQGTNTLSANCGDILQCIYSKIANKISAENVIMNDGTTVQTAITNLQ